ncbi:MAG: hypothetical protein ACOC9B_07560, partial [Chloroflexota bacterium]
STPWTVETINGVPYKQTWIPLARRLVKGRPVNNLLCTFSRSGGRRLVLRVDISPRLSDSGRLTSVMCALGEPPLPPTDGDIRIGSHAREETLQSLMYAWLELDAARQALGRDGTDSEGRLEILACLLKEAVGSLSESY